MRVHALDHVQLAMPPGKEEDARRFYCETLGLTEVPKPEVLAARGGAWFESGTLKIHLGVESDFRPAKKAHPALLVEDLDSLLTRLANSGYKTRPGEHLDGYKRAFTEDPFGNRIELMERV
ncbi:MAG TPA: VOC family protein [Blastocatellia bacterium]|nr:VOC family protein [Blastocatellia bacterium]